MQPSRFPGQPQWLGLCAFTAKDPDSLLVRGTKILQARLCSQNQTNQKKTLQSTVPSVLDPLMTRMITPISEARSRPQKCQAPLGTGRAVTPGPLALAGKELLSSPLRGYGGPETGMKLPRVTQLGRQDQDQRRRLSPGGGSQPPRPPLLPGPQSY